jgi:hypothetical protein
MTKKNAAQSGENARRDEPNLDSRYGEIGISAVAAALQYASGCKTESTKTESVTSVLETDAPVSRQQIKWLADLAA